MDGFTAESALTVALLSGPMFILSLGDRPAVGIVSTALYAAADTAWINYVTVAVPSHVIDLTSSETEVQSEGL